MGRKLRFLPPGSLVAVSSRTIQGRYLLRPCRDLTEITLGILARATRRYDVGICAFVFLSNHFHLLLRPADVEQLALFMSYLNGNLAREAGRLHQWREKFWGRRFTDIVVSDEEGAQVAALQYLLAQGCKEGLVSKPEQWPGASSVSALLNESPLKGLWFDRTLEYNARRCGEKPEKYRHAYKERFSLQPLPAWECLSRRLRQERVADLVRKVEHETRCMLKRERRAPLGIKGIKSQDPHDKPARSARSPAPRFHAATREVRLRLEAAYREFCAAFRQAVDNLRRGATEPGFPAGCFPPHLPFVTESPRLPTALA